MIRPCRLLPVIAGAIFVPAAWAVPTVTLSTQLSQSSVQVGDMVTVTVTASVSDGAADDGLVSYDLDLFPSDKTHLQFIGLASLQPVDSAVGAGTADTTTGGLLGITGVFDPSGIAAGSTVTLFTAQLQALTPGNASVAAGLSVYPNGTGIPFQLNDSGDYVAPPGSPHFNVDTSHAIASLNVTAAPEPATSCVLATALCGLLVRRRRRAAAGVCR